MTVIPIIWLSTISHKIQTTCMRRKVLIIAHLLSLKDADFRKWTFDLIKMSFIHLSHTRHSLITPFYPFRYLRPWMEAHLLPQWFINSATKNSHFNRIFCVSSSSASSKFHSKRLAVFDSSTILLSRIITQNYFTSIPIYTNTHWICADLYGLWNEIGDE